MGSITTSVGLLSGLDTGSLIESLLALDARQKLPLASKISRLQVQKSAYLDVNSSLLALKNLSRGFRTDSVFESTLGISSDEDAVGVTTGRRAQPGSYNINVAQLARSSQRLSSGFASADQDPLGLDELSFEFGRGRAVGDVRLTELNGGAGVRRGSILVTDRAGNTASIDLSSAATVDDVLDAINSETDVQVRAEVRAEGFVLTDLSGGTGDLIVRDDAAGSTATDLGIAQDGQCIGTDRHRRQPTRNGHRARTTERRSRAAHSRLRRRLRDPGGRRHVRRRPRSRRCSADERHGAR